MTPIELQEQDLQELINQVVENPTDDNKQEYLKNLNLLEITILKEAEKYKPKTPEYFSIRQEAFATRGKYAKIVLSKWVAKYGNASGAPHKYEDTLSIPFRSIASPN